MHKEELRSCIHLILYTEMEENMNYIYIIRERCVSKYGVIERADWSVLKWFGHMEKKSEERSSNVPV